MFTRLKAFHGLLLTTAVHVARETKFYETGFAGCVIAVVFSLDTNCNPDVTGYLSLPIILMDTHFLSFFNIGWKPQIALGVLVSL